MIRAIVKNETSADTIALNAKRLALTDANAALGDAADAVTAVEAAANLAEAQTAVDGLDDTISAARSKISDALAV